jgi:hypothetical protein
LISTAIFFVLIVIFLRSLVQGAYGWSFSAPVVATRTSRGTVFSSRLTTAFVWLLGRWDRLMPLR